MDNTHIVISVKKFNEIEDLNQAKNAIDILKFDEIGQGTSTTKLDSSDYHSEKSSKNLSIGVFTKKEIMNILSK